MFLKLKAFYVTILNDCDPYNESDTIYTLVPDWECVSPKSTILDNSRNNKLLVINEILTSQETNEEILEIKVEQVLKFPILNTQPLDQCSFCSEKASEDDDEKKLRRCTKCYRSAYCDADCQMKDWNKHSNTFCCKPLDSVGIPLLITLKMSQIDSIDSLKALITDVSLQSAEISNVNVDLKKKLEFGLVCESKCGSKIEKFETLEETLKIESVHQTRSIRLQLKWSNIGQFRVKTNLSKLVILDEPASQSNQASVSLNDCLKLFTQTEKLTSDNPWFCSKCKKHQEATKQMNIWQLPKYLIVTLKRFQATKASDSLAHMNSEDPTYKYMMMNSRISSFLQNRVVYNKLNTDVKFPLK